MLLIINAVNTASNYFRVIGDASQGIPSGSYIQVLQSTGNNGLYQIATSVYSSGYTTLTVTTSIPDGTTDGVIAGGVYSVAFSQSAITGKATRIVPPYGVDTSTSVKLYGKAALNFGEGLQANLLGLLDNFASTNAPLNPTIGQHWYDYTNKVTKTYVDGAVWSSDVNVENGVISFKDPQHTTPGTKYFLTATEIAGVVGSGVTLYPAINPSTGATMFRVCDATGVSHLSIEFNGSTTSKNPLNVTSSNLSSFTGPQSVNTSNTGSIGLTVSKNIVATGGDVVIDAAKAIKVTGGSSVTLGTTVALRGTAVGGGIICLSTTGTTVATFADASIVFAQPTTIPTLSSTSTSTVTLTATGASTLAATSVTTLTATGASTLAATSVTTLTATGTTTLATANVTTLGVSGTTTLATANVTTLGVSGTTTLATANVTTLGVSGTASLTNGTVSGTLSIQAPTLNAHATTKIYVDNLAATKEPTITAGTPTQYWAGDKTWKDVTWDALRTPAISAGVLTLDLSTPCGFKVTLNQNVTSIVFANVPTNKSIAFAVEWVQDATGGRTINWPASVVTEDGGAPISPDTDPTAVTIQSFITQDAGTTFRMSGVAPPLTSFMLPVGVQTATPPIGTNVESLVVPVDFIVTEVQASLRVAQTTGALVSVDVRLNGTSILSAPVTIDNDEKTSITATDHPTVITAQAPRGSELTFDTVVPGTGAIGLKITVIGYVL